VDLGRFTTPDPLTDLAWTDSTLGATNPYGYVNNNPLRYVDPTGMADDDLVHVQCTGGEACSSITSSWATVGGVCVGVDGGGLDCVRPSHIVQVTAPENSSVTQPLTPMGAGVLSFYPGRGPSAGTGAWQPLHLQPGPNPDPHGLGKFNQCVNAAVDKGLFDIGIDAAALIPGGGLAETVRGGAEVVGGINTVANIGDTSPIGTTSTGLGVAGGVLSIADKSRTLNAATGGLIPVISQFVAIMSIVIDGAKAGMDGWNCSSGGR
jgi:hypothetical protein